MNNKINKIKGCGILFYNDKKEVLLLLRDNKPTIPCPNMWDIPGGHVESNESPKEAIVREVKEELGINLKNFKLFTVTNFDDRVEFTYSSPATFNISDINLMEGQRLEWFSKERVRNTALALGFNPIVETFFDKIFKNIS